MFQRAHLVKMVLKLFIPTLGIFLAYPLSRIIISGLPDLKCPVSVVDLFGFIPSFIAIVAALFIYLQGSQKALKIVKILIFVIVVAASTLLFKNDVFTSTGLNFDKPMIISLVLLTVWNAVFPLLNFEKCPSTLAPIANENSLRETIVSVFSLVGLPLLFIDAYIGCCFFGTGVVGGAGLKDGLNIMSVTLAFYAILLWGTNRLVNRIEK